MALAIASLVAPEVRIYIRAAWLCGVVLFLEGYDIAAGGYAIPSLVEAWRVSPSSFTAALTAGSIGLMLGSVSAGCLGDRLGRKPVLIGCIVIFGIFSLLSAFAGSPRQLAVLRLLTGVGLGGGLPISVALVSDLAPISSQARLLLRMIVGVPVGFAVGGFLASSLVRLYGWPAIFVTGGLLPLALAPLLVLWLPGLTSVPARQYDRGNFASLFQDGLAPRTLLLWAINALSLLGVYVILQWTPALLHSTGFTPSKAILSTTMYGLGTIASPLLAAPLVNRLGIEKVLAYGLTLGACCVLAVGLFYPGFWLILLLLWGAGIGGGSQAGIMSLSALTYPQPIRSTGVGWALGAGRVGTICGPLVAGVLLDLGFHSQKIFVLAAIPAFTAALLMATLGRLRRSQNRELRGCTAIAAHPGRGTTHFTVFECAGQYRRDGDPERRMLEVTIPTHPDTIPGSQ
jgi:AAHS family 4-hydroxybenzoate transporter-like MFS transporter